MASSSAPTVTKIYGYEIQAGSDGKYRVVSSQVYNGTVRDQPDTFIDNLSILGDIQNDTFYFNYSNIGDIPLTYFAESADGEGLVGYASANSPRILLSNKVYNNGEIVDIVSQPYTLCFTTGTLINTARGNIAVEELRVGDVAVTASGRLRPISWIGRRDLDGHGKSLPYDQQPVRLRQGAFGLGLPARDLCLSPGHPVLVGADANHEGGVLVPVMCLINGTSIARESAASVTYWHVELDVHDILLAEGLPAESYYDMGSRVWFAGEDGALVDPDFVPAGEHGRCRPVAVDGPLVEAERVRLDAVFAVELAAHSAWDGADAWLAA